MAFTPTKVWADGNTLLATDLKGNLDDLKVYTHAIEGTAFNGVTAWADTQHLMGGSFEGIPNRYHMMSGIWSGYVSNSGDGQYTYATAYDTGATGDSNFQFLPRAQLTHEVRKPCTFFVQWWAGASTRDNEPGSASQGNASFWVYKKQRDDPGVAVNISRASISRSREEVGPSTSDMIRPGAGEDPDSIPKRSVRYPLNGFFAFDSTEVGAYNVGVVYYSTTAKTQVFSWGVTAECFYF